MWRTQVRTPLVSGARRSLAPGLRSVGLAFLTLAVAAGAGPVGAGAVPPDPTTAAGRAVDHAIAPLRLADDLRGGAAAPTRPDIVVVLLDDLGSAAAELLWSRMPTIRRLFLEGGVTFKDAHGDTPMCCPGRANFLTGLWTHHHGVYRNEARLLRHRATIATAMRRAGYFTLFAGKYLNGMSALRRTLPAGWDRAAMSEGGYYRHTSWLQGRARWFGSAPRDYATDVLADDAVRFLRQAPPRRSVFAVLAPFAVHGGFDHDGTRDRLGIAARRHQGDARCADIDRYRTLATNEADVSDKPAYVRRLRPLQRPFSKGWPMRDACEAMLSVDEMLARVVRELARQGRLERTLFVLTADNGMNYGLHRLKAKGAPYATPIPMLFRWPAGIGPGPAAGRRIRSGLVSLVDLAPTLCEVARCTLGPYPTGQQTSDGVSFLAALTTGAPLPRRALISSFPAADWHEAGRPGWFALRTDPRHPMGAWLYVHYQNGERELYDLEADPHHLRNRAGMGAFAATRTALEQELRRRLGGSYRWR